MSKKIKNTSHLKEETCVLCFEKMLKYYFNLRDNFKSCDDLIYEVLVNLQLFSYDISLNDEKPSFICNSCKKIVENFWNYKRRIQDKQLKFKLINIKSEEECIFASVIDVNEKHELKLDPENIVTTFEDLPIKRETDSSEDDDVNNIGISGDLLDEISVNDGTFKSEGSQRSNEDSETEGEMTDGGDDESNTAETGASTEIVDEEGVTRTIFHNIEFISRQPESLMNALKRQESSVQTRQNPQNWIRFKQRTARARGEEYISRSGKKIRARSLQPPCDKCRYRCWEKVTVNDRKLNFNNYWTLADFILQRKFLFEHWRTEPVVRRRGRTENSKKRGYSTKFFLDTFNDDGTFKEQIKVCETMFLNTFDICKNVLTTLHKKITTGIVQDRRGLTKRKLTPGHLCAIEHVRNNPFFHIEKPMSLSQMYRLYKEECSQKEIQPIKDHTYRKIFADNNECEFLKQSRIICETCDRYYKANEQEKLLLNAKYEEHINTHEKCMQRAKWRIRGKRKTERKRLLRQQLERERMQQNNFGESSNMNYSSGMDLN